MNCGNENNCKMYNPLDGCDGYFRYDREHEHYFAGSKGIRRCYYTETLTMVALKLKEERRQTEFLEIIAEGLGEK